MDLIFIAVIGAFALVCWAFAEGCSKLGERK